MRPQTLPVHSRRGHCVASDGESLLGAPSGSERELPLAFSAFAAASLMLALLGNERYSRPLLPWPHLPVQLRSQLWRRSSGDLRW